MLRKLLVQNYILADNWEVEFMSGTTIITGETGAGKSMLFGAIGLIKGNKFDSNLLFNKTRKCVVEATFFIKNYQIEEFFHQNELDYLDEIIIRREINVDGRSRSFVNDSPVSINLLKDLSNKLIEIHSQHDTLLLNNLEFQLAIVDNFAGSNSLVKEYGLCYRTYTALVKSFNEKNNLENSLKKDLDYFQFQLNELEEIKLENLNQELLEKELKFLEGSNQITDVLYKSSIALTDGDKPIISAIKDIRRDLNLIVKYGSNLEDIQKRIESIQIELIDIASDINIISESFTGDSGQLDKVKSQLDIIYKLQHKHQVNSIAELIDIRNNFKVKINQFSSLENDIAECKKEMVLRLKELETLGKSLSNARHKSVKKIEELVLSILSELGMQGVKFEIKLSTLETENGFSPTGIDKIMFLFAANKGTEPKELHKVASGGELSRLMLALKTIIAEVMALPVILFDEIDSGISGEVAFKMSKVLKRMGKNLQVIIITHLPQIASIGKNHLFVYKEIEKDITYSKIRSLNDSDRVFEIAKMLSNDNPLDSAIKNAEDLLKNS